MGGDLGCDWTGGESEAGLKVDGYEAACFKEGEEWRRGGVTGKGGRG